VEDGQGWVGGDVQDESRARKACLMSSSSVEMARNDAAIVWNCCRVVGCGCPSAVEVAVGRVSLPLPPSSTARCWRCCSDGWIVVVNLAMSSGRGLYPSTVSNPTSSSNGFNSDRDSPTSSKVWRVGGGVGRGKEEAGRQR
jgi:hypothetical protein